MRAGEDTGEMCPEGGGGWGSWLLWEATSSRMKDGWRGVKDEWPPEGEHLVGTCQLETDVHQSDRQQRRLG